MPSVESLHATHIELLNDISAVKDLTSVFTSDSESIDDTNLDIILTTAQSLCGKYGEEFKYLGKQDIDREAYSTFMDIEAEVLNKVAEKIIGKLATVRDAFSDFGKRLSVAIKSNPVNDISKRINDLPVKSVVIDKKELGFINRAFNAYAKARGIKSTDELFKSLMDDDILTQVDGLKKTLDYLSTFDKGEKSDKEIKEEFIKHCKPSKLDSVSYNVVDSGLFKVPKVIYGLKNEIKNKDVIFVASSSFENNYAFTLVGAIQKNFIQKVMSIKDYSDRYMFNTKDKSFTITDLEVSVSDIEQFLKHLDKEFKDINNEINNLYSLKMPVVKGMNFPDSSYFDIYQGIYTTLFGRYSQLMDAMKVADFVSKYSK